MPTNEEGEFELVLGNKQLLSVFFIVVLLLGVFFTMGYIVGRNTVPGGTQVASAKGSQSPLVVDPAGTPPPAATPPPGATPPAQQSERPSPAGAPIDPPKPEPPKQTAAQQPPQQPKPEPAKVEPAKPEPAKPAPAPPPAVSVKPTAPKGGGPAPGRYLQVAATRQAEADLLGEVLGKKGYPTLTTPVPDSALVRVMVGPIPEANYQRIRGELEAAGFKPFPRSF